jgi:hypothetical protein
MDLTIAKAEMIQGVGYLGVATTIIIYYEHILTFPNEGKPKKIPYNHQYCHYYQPTGRGKCN